MAANSNAHVYSACGLDVNNEDGCIAATKEWVDVWSAHVTRRNPEI